MRPTTSAGWPVRERRQAWLRVARRSTAIWDVRVAGEVLPALVGDEREAVVFGEVGLSGEVRHVPHIEKRLAEAKKLGFDAAIGPVDKSAKKASFLHGVPDVRSALNQFLEK